MGNKQLQDLLLQGKKVLVRVDFNVPQLPDGTITDDSRIRESLPTIQYILDKGGSVILLSHLGRPKSRKDLQFSLGICAKHLSKLLSAPVFFAPDCVGKEVEKMVQELKNGQILLLENLRFYPAEENPSADPNFAKSLASFGDFFVQDAFSACHRAHSSITQLPSFFAGKAAFGLLLEKELSFLTPLTQNPKRPYFAILGGAKVSSKLETLYALLHKVDALFIGGGMAFTFLKAQGFSIGNSLVEDDLLSEAEQVLTQAKNSQKSLYLPEDLVIGDSFTEKAHVNIVSIKEGIPSGWMGMDIGPETIASWKNQFLKAATIFWNGPLGVCEFPPFSTGTREVAQGLTATSALCIAGGGDSVAAITRLGLKKNFSHLSTGGGASLEFFEQGTLPGIEAIKKT